MELTEILDKKEQMKANIQLLVDRFCQETGVRKEKVIVYTVTEKIPTVQCISYIKIDVII